MKKTKKLNYFIVAAGIAGLLFTATPQTIYKNSEEQKVCTESKGDMQKLEDLVIEKGDKFSITLSVNPSSGYCWNEKFDTEYLQLTYDDFVPYNTPADLNYIIPPEIAPCAQEKHLFKFIALKSGKTEITFSYNRPWEKDKKQPLDQKKFVIEIK